MTLLDGEQSSWVEEYEGEGYSEDLSFCTDLTPGNHKLEVFAADSCCDEELIWYLSVRDNDWELFTTDALAKYAKVPDIEGDTLVEFGTVTLDQPDKDSYYNIDIVGKFNSPVVVMGPLSNNENQPVTVRVRDVTRKNFLIQIQEWWGSDFVHASEDISYMIVEEGKHQLSDGTWIEASKLTGGREWSDVAFTAPFEQAPMVFSQITT